MFISVIWRSIDLVCSQDRWSRKAIDSPLGASCCRSFVGYFKKLTRRSMDPYCNQDRWSMVRKCCTLVVGCWEVFLSSCESVEWEREVTVKSENQTFSEKLKKLCKKFNTIILFTMEMHLSEIFNQVEYPCHKLFLSFLCLREGMSLLT